MLEAAQELADLLVRELVQREVRDARLHAVAQLALHRVEARDQLAEDGFARRGRPRARDVAAVAEVRRAGVDQEDLAVARRARFAW